MPTLQQICERCDFILADSMIWQGIRPNGIKKWHYWMQVPLKKRGKNPSPFIPIMTLNTTGHCRSWAVLKCMTLNLITETLTDSETEIVMHSHSPIAIKPNPLCTSLVCSLFYSWVCICLFFFSFSLSLCVCVLGGGLCKCLCACAPTLCVHLHVMFTGM